MTMVNAYVPGKAQELSEESRSLLARRERALGPAYRLFYETPVHFVRGEGAWLFDEKGRRYLDAYNNVASLGHSRLEVVEAIARQSRILNTHTRYLHPLVVEYAERLLATFPDEISNAIFTCTGSEANDLAWRIAKTVTGNAGLIVTRNAYHGITDAIAQASPSFGRWSPIGDFVRVVPEPALEGDVAGRFAAGVAAAIADLDRAGLGVAALLVDTVFSSDGLRPDPAGFLRGAVEQVRAAGGLFIADEVQAGFARVGTPFWGFARHGLIPDLVTMGKPMGNGHPVAGLVGQAEHMRRFGEKVRYFNTFGGNPVSCAAAMAVLDVLERERLAENAERVGASLRARFEALARRFPFVEGVRQVGLFLSLDIAPAHGRPGERAGAIVNHMRDNGVLISATGPTGDALKIRPLLIFTQAEADLLTQALEAALSAVEET